MNAADLRKRRPKPHTTWHLDEAYLKIDGRMVYLWRAVDLQINFVQMPDRMWLGPALSQVRCDDRPEMIHPASDCLVGDRNSTLSEQIFDVAKAQREPKIEPNRLLNDLGREPVPSVADFRHSLWLPRWRSDRNIGST